MKARKKREIRFAICIVDSEPDLKIRKAYKVLRTTLRKKKST
jgi:hypothetical protein